MIISSTELFISSLDFIKLPRNMSIKQKLKEGIKGRRKYNEITDDIDKISLRGFLFLYQFEKIMQKVLLEYKTRSFKIGHTRSGIHIWIRDSRPVIIIIWTNVYGLSVLHNYVKCFERIMVGNVQCAVFSNSSENEMEHCEQSFWWSVRVIGELKVILVVKYDERRRDIFVI